MISKISSFIEPFNDRIEASAWRGELEWPEELVGLLEVRSNRVDFMNKILHANDVVLSEIVLNDFVRGKRNSLFVDLEQ